MKSGKVLLAEDDPAVRGLLKEVLEKEGFQVKTTFLGESVVSMCQEEKFDVLVLDMLFPDTDGVEILRQINIKLPEVKKNIRILAISGGGCGDFLPAEYLLKMAGKWGAEKFLIKPFSIDVFKKALLEI